MHAIACSVSGLYGVPHGLANAMILPHVARLSCLAAEAKLASLSRLSGISSETHGDRYVRMCALGFYRLELRRSIDESASPAGSRSRAMEDILSDRASRLG